MGLGQQEKADKSFKGLNHAKQPMLLNLGERMSEA